jgi:Holliday junction DNA helicase RuvA
VSGEAGTVSLAIETHVREDHIHLYGFIDEAERSAFRLLTTVQGVGAKLALAILSTLSADMLAQAIAAGDRAALNKAPGVGPKLAARIVAELKDKAPAFGAVDPLVARLSGDTEAENTPSAVRDAISALVNLGYGRPQAAAAVAASVKKLGEGAETGALIRHGLTELAA